MATFNETKTLKDFPNGTRIQHSLSFEGKRYYNESTIVDGKIVSTYGTFTSLKPYMVAHHSDVRKSKTFPVHASGWKFVKYWRNGTWVPLNSFYDEITDVNSDTAELIDDSIQLLNDTTKLCKDTTKLYQDTVTEIEQLKGKAKTILEEPVVEQQNNTPEIKSDVKFAQLGPVDYYELEPLRLRYQFHKDGSYAILEPKLVHLPFNIGLAWIDMYGHCWEAVATDNPHIRMIGKYIGVFYEKEKYLALKIPDTFRTDSIPPINIIPYSI